MSTQVTGGSILPDDHDTPVYVPWKQTRIHITLDWPQHEDMLKVIHVGRSLRKQLYSSLGNGCNV